VRERLKQVPPAVLLRSSIWDRAGFAVWPSESRAAPWPQTGESEGEASERLAEVVERVVVERSGLIEIDPALFWLTGARLSTAGKHE